MSSDGFKAIVVGAGPTGLTTAHALTKAGLDFIVLEGREDAVNEGGSHLVMSSMGLSALSQLGLSDAVDKVSSPLPQVQRINDRGRDIGTLNWFEFHKRDFGFYPKIISRHDLNKLLFESLPLASQAKILTGKKVSDVRTEADGVRVTCKDGSSFSGTIVIGADGAHSMIRGQMRTLALAAGSDEVNEEKPFLTTYRALWMSFPTALSDKVPAGFSSETHKHGACTQLFAGADTAVVAMYETMEKPTRDRIRFTQADEDAMIERHAHLPLIEGGSLTFGDVYKNRIASGMVSLEEGVVDHWSWDGRMVLVGDAAHKFTPITGAGCNNGIADVVVLANEMHKAFQETAAAPGNEYTTPGREELAAAFKAYQSKRFEPVKAQCARAGQTTAASTWASGLARIIDQYIMSSKMVQKQLWGNRARGELPAFYFANNEETGVRTKITA
ncbi:FAD/NAD(P)-binding domain-containing protein [Xylariaceae sp. FL1651]|nr:FAD/NAD(P)-binding domain-containing protein [Xylariaceae sp. FL1651]